MNINLLKKLAQHRADRDKEDRIEAASLIIDDTLPCIESSEATFWCIRCHLWRKVGAKLNMGWTCEGCQRAEVALMGPIERTTSIVRPKFVRHADGHLGAIDD